MHIALISPYHLDVPGGNVTAIQRLASELRRLDHEVDVYVPDQNIPAGKRFDVVHGLHALRGGDRALLVGEKLGIPVVITLTGTDVDQGLSDPEERAHVLRNLSLVDGVVALHASQLALARERSGLALAASEVIEQGISVGHQPYRFRTLNGFLDDQFVVLLPAGLRRVKAPHLALEAQRLRAVDEPEWELALVGPILEDAYAGELLERMEHFPHTRWCGPIPTGSMGACYAESDVVLNTSESEGASNAILEAQLSGVPVLARDNAGNRALIEDGVDGLLYGTSAEMARALCNLQRDGSLRLTLARGGRERAARYPSPKEEALAHLELYRRLLG